MKMRMKTAFAGLAGLGVVGALLVGTGVAGSSGFDIPGIGPDDPSPAAAPVSGDGFGVDLIADEEIVEEVNESASSGGPPSPDAGSPDRIEVADPGQVKDAEDAVDLHRTVTAAVLPENGTAEALVTPAGDDWWAMATGLAVQLELDGTAAPTGAQWYAFSGGRSYGSNADLTPYWTAVHVGFPDQEQAQTFAETARGGEGSERRYVHERGMVVTVVPASIYPEEETFLPEQPVIEVDKPVSRATWIVDWMEKAKVQSQSHPNSGAYVEFWSTLGFDISGSAWSATSARPEGPWLGAVGGWDYRRVDVDGASRVIAGTLDQACEEVEEGGIAVRTCIDEDEGLTRLYEFSGFADREGGRAGHLPVSTPKDTSAVLAGVFQPDAWTSEFQTGRLHDSTVEAVRFTVDDKSRMTVRVETE